MRYRPVDVAIGRSDQNDGARPCGQRRGACVEAGRAERAARVGLRVDADRGTGTAVRSGPRAGGEASAGG